ncbi:MAG: FtsX-like permease family protein [Planctomycetia bacterium]|nr:FtsX-like permease family protein [Planctomycetia bacterium]
MYKLLLTWRYLLTRYIALVCVISVTLGVATLIVVNAVMLGFSREMENKIHGVLSDVMIGSRSSLRGFDDVDQRVEDVWNVAGEMIEAVTPTVTTLGLLCFELPGNETSTHYVQVIGIDPESYAKVTSISQFVQHPKNREHLSFQLQEEGYDIRNPLFGKNGTERRLLADAGWKKRRKNVKYEKFLLEEEQRQREIYQSLPKPQSDSDSNVSGGFPVRPSTDSASSNQFGLSADPNDPSGLKNQNNQTNNINRSKESSDDSNDPYEAVLQNLPSVPEFLEDSSKDSPKDSSENPSGNSNSLNPDVIPSETNSPLLAQNQSNQIDLTDSFETNPIESPTPTDSLSEMSVNITPSAQGTSPLDQYEEFQTKFDKETQQDCGIILGMGIVSGLRRRVIDPETKQEVIRESLMVVPGDDVTLSLYASGTERSFQALMSGIVYDRFTITDLYECRMSDYDENFVYVPLDKLQELRKMIADDGTRLATNLLIKAKPGVDIVQLRNRLQESEKFPPQLFKIETWRDNQSTLLGAVAIERSILNILLFMIIAVAGFGILAIFFMIVVEKTKDIGIMKSLGASGFGIMQIFLFYGLALGLVGSGFGLILGLLIVHNINVIAAFLSKLMGHEVFDPSIYMFQQVPAIVDPLTVVWVVIGSVFIAVLSGVLPAIRAARLKPVDALRV